MVKCLVAILLLCISIVSASVEAGQHNKSTPPIVLEISTDKQSYHIGESVILFVKFKNVTDSSVSLPPEFLFEEHFILLTMYKDNTAVPFRWQGCQPVILLTSSCNPANHTLPSGNYPPSYIICPTNRANIDCVRITKMSGGHSGLAR